MEALKDLEHLPTISVSAGSFSEDAINGVRVFRCKVTLTWPDGFTRSGAALATLSRPGDVWETMELPAHVCKAIADTCAVPHRALIRSTMAAAVEARATAMTLDTVTTEEE